MARDGRPQPFPFPIPDPPVTRRVQRSTPFPPPPLPPPDETVNVLARRVAGVPLPLFFAIGAVVGIVLAMTVVSIVRRGTPKRATRADVVSVQAAPFVEHARALFVWPPPTAAERAPSPEPTVELDEPRSVTSLAVTRTTPATPKTRAAVAMNRPMNRPRTSARGNAPIPVKREAALPSDLLSAGL